MTYEAALAEVLERNPSLPSLSEPQRAGLILHGELLARWNRVHNLTRLQTPEEVATRHWADTLAGLAVISRYLPEATGGAIADVGSGAGFPGIPAALLWPQREIVLVEAARKRASFLQQVARELKLANLRIDNRRQEEVPRGTFAAVLTRATLPWQSLPDLGELLQPRGLLAAWVAEEPDGAGWDRRLIGTRLEEGRREPYDVSGLPTRAILLARRDEQGVQPLP